MGVTTPDANRPLRIAVVAPLWTAVPPSHYGGSELIVHLLTEELVRRGHQVTLFASGDSRTAAQLHTVCPANLRDAMLAGQAFEYEHYANASIAETLREQDRFDVIHSQLGYAQLPFARTSRTPLIATAHTVPGPDDRWVVDRCRDLLLVAVSTHQRSHFPALIRENARVVHHGIDTEAYALGQGAGGYAIFLGRMSAQKSPAHAIRIARAARMPIVLAGAPQDARDQTYFEREVVPLIDGDNVRYVGAVNHEQKSALLREARVLLFPIQGEEAFGIAMVEAMACGTPVLGWDRASVPQIVEAGVTGFVGDSIDDLAALVPEAARLDRRAIREAARRHFSVARMVDDYEQAYRDAIAGRWRDPTCGPAPAHMHTGDLTG